MGHCCRCQVLVGPGVSPLRGAGLSRCASRHRGTGVSTLTGFHPQLYERPPIAKTSLCIKNWLARHPRFQVHFTPTSASWLNQVERWFATLTQKYIRRGTHRSTRQLEQAIRHDIKVNNNDPKPFVWSKTADDILASVEKFCLRTSNSRH